MTHALIIRFHYAQDDPRFDWRLAYFQTMVLPRILKQTRNDFDIAIRCNPWHEEIFKKLSPRIVTFRIEDEEVNYKATAGKLYFYDFVGWNRVIGLPMYDIQSGLDSDDLISYNYIEKIVDTIEKNAKGESLHLSFQPGLFKIDTLEKERMPQRYNNHKGSAFMSLYQPKKDDYKFIYEKSHLNLWKLAHRTITIPEGYCWASVHNLNESTGV